MSIERLDDSQSAISVQHLTHEYTSGQSITRILDDVALDVNKGQSVALIGRSGSGKSTLLNLISGLEPIAQGEVWLDGEALKALNDRRLTLLRGRHIGFIYQAFNLIPTLSVYDNIALPLALLGMPANEQSQRIHELLAAVGLDSRAQQYPDTLSGGEQQRVAIARALVHKPALILADEPTGNLDADSGRQVLQLLMDLVRQQHSAMLLVTHSMEVAGIADQILVLNNGQIQTAQADELASSSTW